MSVVENNSSMSPSSVATRGALRPWVAILPYLLFVVSVFLCFAETPDDPFITFRYAANVLAGHGAVFNAGEQVEGFSSPLHLLISVLLVKLVPHNTVLFAAKLASLLFGFLTLAVLRRFGRLMGLRPVETVIAQCLVALSVNFAYASVNALETTLYGWLLVIAVCRFTVELDRRSGIASADFLALALTARPDALLIFAALFIVRYFVFRRQQISQSGNFGWALVFLVLAGLVFGARLAYYHQLFPNTYYAKSVRLTYGLTRGAFYILRSLSPVPIGPDRTIAVGPGHAYEALQCFWALAFWGATLVGTLRLRRDQTGWICTAIVIAQIVFVLKCGGDWMSGWRFMVPVLPFIVVLQCYGLRTLADKIGKQNEPTRAPGPSYPGYRPALGVAFAVALSAVVVAPHDSWAKAHFSTDGAALLATSGGSESHGGPMLVGVGDFLRRAPAGSVISYSEMGYCPYVNLDKKFIDIHGLTEPELAHLPSAHKERIGYVDRQWSHEGSVLNAFLAKRRPDIVIALFPVKSGGDPDVTLGDRVYHSIHVITGADDVVSHPQSAHIYVPVGSPLIRLLSQ